MSELKNGFLTAEEVMDILQIKQSKAYQIIRQLNKELSGMGLITVPGRVDANYFKVSILTGEVCLYAYSFMCSIAKFSCNGKRENYRI